MQESPSVDLRMGRWTSRSGFDAVGSPNKDAKIIEHLESLPFALPSSPMSKRQPTKESEQPPWRRLISRVLLALLAVTTSSMLPDTGHGMAEFDLKFSNPGIGWDRQTLAALRVTPTQWSNTVVWVDALGFYSVCALDAGRTLRCWMLALDPSRPSEPPILSHSPLGFEISQVRATILNANFSCVLREGGEVWCWSPEGIVPSGAPPPESFCRPVPTWLMNAESIFAIDYGICARQGRQVQCVTCTGINIASKHLLPSATAPVIAGIPHALCQRLDDGRLECDGCVLSVQALSTGGAQAFEHFWWTAWEADNRTIQSQPTPRHFFVDPPSDWTDARWGVDTGSLRALGLRAQPGHVARLRPSDVERTTPNYLRGGWCDPQLRSSLLRPNLIPMTGSISIPPSFPPRSCAAIGQFREAPDCDGRP